MDCICNDLKHLKITDAINKKLQDMIVVRKIINYNCSLDSTLMYNSFERNEGYPYSTETLNNYAPFYDCVFSPFETNAHICFGVNEAGYLLCLDTRQTTPNILLSNKQINPYGHPIYTIDWGYHNNMLVTTNSDKVVGLYDAYNQTTIQTITLSYSIRCALFNPWNNNIILAGGRNNSISIIDKRTRTNVSFVENIKSNKKSHPPVVNSVVFLNENYFSCSTDRNNYITIWDSRFSKKKPFSYVSYYGEAICNIGYTHLKCDVTSMYAACTDNKIYKFSIAKMLMNKYNKQSITTNSIKSHENSLIQCQPNAIYACDSQRISTNIKLDINTKNRLLLCGSQDNTVIMWDIDRPSTPIANLPFYPGQENTISFPNYPALGGTFSRFSDTLVTRNYEAVCVWKTSPSFHFTSNHANNHHTTWKPYYYSVYAQSFKNIIDYRNTEIKASDKIAMTTQSYYMDKIPNIDCIKSRKRCSQYFNNSDNSENINLYDFIHHFNLKTVDNHSIISFNPKNYYFKRLYSDGNSRFVNKKEIYEEFKGKIIHDYNINQITLDIKIFYTLQENKHSIRKKLTENKSSNTIMCYLKPLGVLRRSKDRNLFYNNNAEINKEHQQFTSFTTNYQLVHIHSSDDES